MTPIHLFFCLLTCHPAPYRQLTWADFQGRAPRSTLVAETVTNIDITTEGDENRAFAYTIDCYFCPGESWTKTQDPGKLRHEQGHFDISHYYALLIEWRLRSYQHTTDKAGAERMIKRLLDDWKTAEIQYDQETDHSRNTPAQKKWEDYIQTELKSM